MASSLSLHIIPQLTTDKNRDMIDVNSIIAFVANRRQVANLLHDRRSKHFNLPTSNLASFINPEALDVPRSRCAWSKKHFSPLSRPVITQPLPWASLRFWYFALLTIDFFLHHHAHSTPDPLILRSFQLPSPRFQTCPINSL